MRRINFFIIVLIATIAVLLTLTFVSWYFAMASPSYYGSSWMGQMWGSHLGTDSNYGMGGMMGNGSTATATPSYLWLVPVVLGVVVGVAVIGVAFYYAYPELKYIRGNPTCTPVPANTGVQTQAISPAVETGSPATTNANTPKVAKSCDVLLKTMTPEEQKVLSVLVAHNGKYLQKYVVKESGLSRLKTHRIVARFAQRGIVTVNEFGNTNEIVVSDWVKS
jgi:uncharacterized membrane protein